MAITATEPEKAIFPPFLSSFLEEMENEGIYLGQENLEVKRSSLEKIEDKAIRAANEAFRETLLLYNSKDLSEAARILEKIQVAAAEAELSAFIVHGPRLRKANQIAKRLASLSREFFHEFKERNAKKTKTAA